MLLYIGLSGTTLYVAFVSSLAGLVLQGLGLIVSRTNWIVYIGCLLTGLTGSIVLALHWNALYTGLAVYAGLFLGLSMYIVGVGFTKPIKATQGESKDCGNTEWKRQQLLLVAAMSGVMCHWSETAFLFPTAATRLIFCLCAGIILVVSSKRLESVEAQPSVTPLKSSAAKKKKGGAASLKIAEDNLNNETLADQSLMTMLWPAVCIITLFAYEIFGPLHFRDPHFEFYAASLIWSVWILVGVFCVAIFGCARSWKYVLSRLGLLGLCSAFITLVLIGVSGPEKQDVVLVELRWNVIAVFLLAGTLFFAGVLYHWQSRKSVDQPFSVRQAWPIYLIPFFTAIVIYFGWSGNAVKADMYKKLSNAHFETYKRSATLNAAQQQPLSQEQIAVFDKTLALARLAVETNPHGEQHWTDLAELLTVRATWPAELALKKEYYNKAEEALNRASKLNPYSIRTIDRQANFYWIKYKFYPDENDRENALFKADVLATRILEFAPTLTIMNTQAAEILATAGDIYFAAGKYEKAEIAYTKLLSIDTKKPQSLFWLGTTLHKLKRFEEAETYLLKANELSPSDWKISVNLTVLYKDWNNIPKALKTAQDALLTAPPEKRLELEMFIKNSR
jgi:tetratricopeptide (TPR) repeat protein